MVTDHATETVTEAGLGPAVATRSAPVLPAPKADHKRQRQIATRIKTIETRLARLSEKMTEAEQALSDPKHYSDPDSPTLQGLLRERVSLQSQIDDFEEEWLRLESEREGLS